MKTEEIIEEVFGLYLQHGHEDYIGEPVSQLEHMSQSAQLAIDEGYDDETVLAAFFHDIGHLLQSEQKMAGYGNLRHEQLGAAFLRDRGFPERVARLVENHVQAKRYLTYKFPEYRNNLSEASRKTLEFQGGMMSGEEAAAFEEDPFFDASIRMRIWDEQAKQVGLPLIGLAVLKEKAAKILQKP
ncbi:MAG: phosphonate degradation HD-domain oxygenase [Cyclobacteriaceae bacterium]|jgi:phosphonate degradation associated HDIG domain protein